MALDKNTLIGHIDAYSNALSKYLKDEALFAQDPVANPTPWHPTDFETWNMEDMISACQVNAIYHSSYSMASLLEVTYKMQSIKREMDFLALPITDHLTNINRQLLIDSEYEKNSLLLDKKFINAETEIQRT